MKFLFGKDWIFLLLGYVYYSKNGMREKMSILLFNPPELYMYIWLIGNDTIKNITHISRLN